MQILIFTEISKKIGAGHYERSLRLKKKLEKKNKIFFYKNFNKKKIKKKLSLLKKPSIIYYDFKDHSKSVIKKSNDFFFILMESNGINRKNVININPLNLKKGRYYGPKWSCYPDDFFKNIKNLKNFKNLKNLKNQKIKNLLISQGATDAHNNLAKILKLIQPFIKKYNLKVYIKSSNFIKLPLKLRKDTNVKIVSRLKNVSSLLKKIHFAITSCGNFCHEINFFGIKTMFVTSEPREILRAKKLQKLGFGNYINLTDKKKFSKELLKLINGKNLNDGNFKKIKFFQYNGMLNIINLIMNVKKNVQK